MITSTPNVTEFDPREIPWQFELIRDVRKRFDYSKGTHEVLLSGSVGSGKSLPLAHLIVTHCLLYQGANFGVGRRALPRLKATLLKKIREHLARSGVSFSYNKSSGDITFPNGSLITAFSWADGNYEKFGSYELSGMAIEEGTETRSPEAYEYALTRVGRLPHVPENLMIVATNPDAPSHWLHKRFIEEPTDVRHVYYSLTEQNRFLAPSYIDSLKQNLDPKLARRLLRGEWIELNQDRLYHAYESDRNFLKGKTYTINPRFPIRFSFDFNIAKGKPLSVVWFQFIDDQFHFFEEIIVEGLRTEGALEEAASRGLLEHPCLYIIHGDAAGKHSDTRSIRSDYDIIKNFLTKYKTRSGQSVAFRVDVPLANPPLRTRHNLVNAYCLNDTGLVRLHVYGPCKTLDEGMRLTQLKDNAQYIEDDSKAFQHCTTALGYGILSCVRAEGRQAPTGLAR